MTQKPFHVVSVDRHNDLVRSVYLHRGYNDSEAAAAVRSCEMAATHGIRTHNGIKALYIDKRFGSQVGGCTPGAEIERLPSRFEASQVWNAHKKLGQAVAFEAMDTCIELADRFGIGQVSVDNALHYLWGGGYVMDAARRGYIAYTNCTGALAEVVPYQGRFPTLGTNPHSWGFPTVDAVGFPIVIDWATSTVAMGRVQQFAREGRVLPPGAAVDADGRPTTDPRQVAALLPFGAHKGYGLSVAVELVSAFIGGSLPTLRNRSVGPGEKRTTNFYFQVIHPESLSAGAFALGRSQSENVRAVIDDILGHGNDGCLLPGQVEADAARATELAGGLLFTAVEIEEFNQLTEEVGAGNWTLGEFPVAKT